MTPVWISPDTSMTSRVSSSQGTLGHSVSISCPRQFGEHLIYRGNEMFMCISIFSPVCSPSAIALLLYFATWVYQPLPLSTMSSGCTTTLRKSLYSWNTKYNIRSNEATVTIPPDVVRTLASSTVFVNASRRVNLDLAGIVKAELTLFANGSRPARNIRRGVRVFGCLTLHCSMNGRGPQATSRFLQRK